MKKNSRNSFFLPKGEDQNVENGQRSLTVLPSHEELSSICNLVECPEKNCKSVFQCSSNLAMHLVKHHKISDELLKPDVNVQYACPVESCKYSFKSSKHFTKKKYLKQHYLKCHAKREYVCEQCKKPFATISMQKAHEKICGQRFVCSCGWTYTSREALLTHCKRKKHAAVVDHQDTKIGTKRDSAHNVADSAGHNNANMQESVKNQFRKRCASPPDDEEESAEDELKEIATEADANGNVEENRVVKVCISSPPHSRSPRKPANDVAVFPTHYIAAIALSELSTTFIIPKNCHIGVQTVDTKVAKKTRSCYDKKRKNSQETQTAGTASKCKRQRICAETQTVSHVKRKSRNIIRKRKKSTETQTKDPMPFLSSVGADSLDGGIFNESSSSSSAANESQDKSDVRSTAMDDDAVWNNQSFEDRQEEQSKPYITTINSSMFNLNNELTIDTRGGDMPLSHFTNFDKLCNNETQTELETLLQSDAEGTSTIETQTSEDLFNDLIYSNMCTQTCDDVGDLFDFDFVDIETQTAWPDL